MKLTFIMPTMSATHHFVNVYLLADAISTPVSAASNAICTRGGIANVAVYTRVYSMAETRTPVSVHIRCTH